MEVLSFEKLWLLNRKLPLLPGVTSSTVAEWFLTQKDSKDLGIHLSGGDLAFMRAILVRVTVRQANMALLVINALPLF